MGIFFGKETRSSGQTFPEPPIPAYLGAPVGGRTSTSVTRNPDSALTIPTVWACVGLLANTVSMMPLETYRSTSGGFPRKMADPQVVTTPAGDMTQSEWLHMVVVSLLLRGNAYGLITQRDPETFLPTQVDLLNPDKVRMSVEDGKLVYKIGSSDKDRSSDIWHVRGLTMPGSRQGLSPIAYAAATMGVDIYSREFASNFFSDGAHPSAILSTTQPVNQEQARTIKDRFAAAVRGREPAVLGAGVEYKPIQVAPNESQFLEAQQANVAQIARFFWIPAEMVGGPSGNSMTYANVEQRSLDFLTYAVSFWLKRVEDAFSTLLPDNQFVRFNTSALLRTDAETQAKVDAIRIASKVVVPSEVRPSLNLAPMTDAQKAEAELVPLITSPMGTPKAKALPPPQPAAADTQGAADG